MEPKTSPKKKAALPRRLVLIDGHAILHRAYHALPPLTNRAGKLLNATYGFCTMLFKVINDLKPDFLIVTFDVGKPTFRHEEFVGYQAQRPAMEVELIDQLDQVREILQAMGIPIYEVEGYEADDVLGTLARQAVKSKRVKRVKKVKKVNKVIIVTGDRDIWQLVRPKTLVFAPVRGLSQGEFLGPKEVRQKMGVAPSQIVDYKALAGDASDNYPGVPGIGPKTAIVLLEKFGSLSQIYKNLAQVKKEFGLNVFKKLIDGQDSAELSQKLARIVTDVPVRLNLTKARFVFTPEERKATISKLKELNFKSLVARLEQDKQSLSLRDKPSLSLRDRDRDRDKGKQLNLI